MVPAAFQDIQKTDDVRFDIAMWVGQRIAHTRLGGKMAYRIEFFLEKKIFKGGRFTVRVT